MKTVISMLIIGLVLSACTEGKPPFNTELLYDANGCAFILTNPSYMGGTYLYQVDRMPSQDKNPERCVNNTNQ